MKMDRQQARERINSQPLTAFITLTPSKGGLYVCPICGSGTGRNRTGALSISKENRVACFAKDCFKSEDGRHETQDTIGALRRIWNCSESEVFQRLGYDVGGDSGTTSPRSRRAENATKKEPVKEKAEPKPDFRSYIADAQRALAENPKAQTYLAGRGFTPETIERFMLGYDRKKDAIVVPYGKAGRYYITRAIGEKAYRKPKTDEAGAEPIYNAACLYAGDAPAVFVVESALCAISIMQEGGAAIALNGTGSGKLTEKINAQPTQKTLVLCLDNDEAGQKAQSGLAEHLQEMGVSFIVYNVAGDHKDPNEHLQNDRAAFAQAVKDGIRAAEEARAKAKEEAEAKRQALAYSFKARYSAAGRLESFLGEIDASINNPPQPTGFPKLDAILDGGLYSGYAILTGETSVGKTAFALQIADNIAESGRDVLYFTLEMSAFDLMARSISRLTAELCNDDQDAKTCRYITDATKRANFSKAERELVARATLHYADNIAPHICFIEPRQMGKHFLSYDDIRAVLEEYKNGAEEGQQMPVVVVDYLQLMRPDDAGKGYDVFQYMSSTATVLYHLSKEYNAPFVTLTSQPRSAYANANAMSGGKGSGDIEYSAEYLFRLRAPRARTDADRADPDSYALKEKSKLPRTIHLAIMKNRAGAVGKAVSFSYDPRFNLFTETGVTDI